MATMTATTDTPEVDKTDAEQQPIMQYLPSNNEAALRLEEEHVHKVYDVIATHFSDTRHTPWPRVKQFLLNLDEGSLVADIGCGNGKYLGVNPNLYTMGSDRSANLASICAERNHNVLVADCMDLPFRTNSFDHLVCIAVLHHLSTQERRLHSVAEMARVVRPGGTVLIYVWAIEQPTDEKQTAAKCCEGNEAEKNNVMVDESNSNEADVVAKNLANLSTLEDATVAPKVNAAEEPYESESATSEEKQRIHINEKRNVFHHPDLFVPWNLKDTAPKPKKQQPPKQKKQKLSKKQQRKHLNDQTSSAGCNASNADQETGQPTDVEVGKETDTGDVPEKGSDSRKSNAHIISSEININQIGESGDSESNTNNSNTIDNNTTNNNTTDNPTTNNNTIDNPTNNNNTTDNPTTNNNTIDNPTNNNNTIDNKTTTTTTTNPYQDNQVFQRFYHVFSAGELRTLCEQVGGVEVVDEYLDRGNWSVTLKKI